MIPNDIRQARLELTAALRWAAKLGYQSGICNHFTLMLPGSDNLFLVTPEGWFWDEVTASSLLVCDLDGNVVEGEGTVEESAFALHAPIHRRHPSARAVLHTHMPNATAICAIDGGRIEPVNQEGLRFFGRVAYDENYAGVARDTSEGERVARILGDAQIMMLRNHGPFVVGGTMAQAFDRLYYLEQHCRVQLLAMRAGHAMKPVTPSLAESIASNAEMSTRYADNHMAAIMRSLDRAAPGWRE